MVIRFACGPRIPRGPRRRRRMWSMVTLVTSGALPLGIFLSSARMWPLVPRGPSQLEESHVALGYLGALAVSYFSARNL